SGGDVISRRLACACACARTCSVVRLVFPETERAPFRLHLAPRHPPTHSRRSNDECCLEIHVTDGVHVCHRRGGLALCGARLTRLAMVVAGDRGWLQRAVGPTRHTKEIRAACLSFR